jgi:phosphoenolpyruvate synthase/pyruvate phosphate dikinase
MANTYVVPLDTKADDLEVVGGKGRSLARMTNAGFQVPGGFQITTRAYRKFVADNVLQEKIMALASPVVVTDIGSILAHGSIVAREYGIPAVLGTGDATQRIKHGQIITIDGDAGTVEIHEDETEK